MGERVGKKIVDMDALTAEAILEQIAKFRVQDADGYGYDAAVDALEAIEAIVKGQSEQAGF